jgi:hypothetical protein
VNLLSELKGVSALLKNWWRASGKMISRTNIEPAAEKVKYSAGRYFATGSSQVVTCKQVPDDAFCEKPDFVFRVHDLLLACDLQSPGRESAPSPSGTPATGLKAPVHFAGSHTCRRTELTVEPLQRHTPG